MISHSSNLFELSTLQRAINSAISDHDGDLDAAGVEELFDKNYPELEAKLRAYGWMIETSQIEVRELDGWIQRLESRRAGVVATEQSLRKRMAEAMLRSEIKKVEGQTPVDLEGAREHVRFLASKQERMAAPLREAVRALGEILNAARPPISWKAAWTPGKIDTTEDFDMEIVRTWGTVHGYPELVVDPPRPPQPESPPPRLDKALAKKILKLAEIPGVFLEKEAKLHAGE